MKQVAFIFLVFLLACTESTVEPDFSRTGAEYFPLKVGQYVIYDVESIEYDILGTVDTSRFQLKSEVIDSFESQAGTIKYIIHRHSRETSDDPWEFQTAWSSYANSNQAILIEENIPYLKLTFPIEKDRVWDGNKLNSLEQDDYTLTDLDQGFVTTQGDSLTHILRVVQSNNQDTIIQQDKRIEMYAQDIGLVYKQSLLFNYCAETSCINQQIVESGFSYEQKLLEYGQN